MVKRIWEKILLSPGDISPSQNDLEVIGVFNPGAVRVGDEIFLLVRVAESAREKRKGFFSSPVRVRKGNEWITKIEWFPIPTDSGDKRSYDTGGRIFRLTFLSHLRLVKLNSIASEITWIDEKPTFLPEEEYEEFGVEDPRITKIDDEYYITYVACSRKLGICTALVKTSDFMHFERKGIIFAMENKDVLILPEKLNEDFIAYHRPGSGFLFQNLSMQIAQSHDLIHWGRHKHLMSTRPGFWDDFKIGGGCVPFRSEKGWLAIYHGVMKKTQDDQIGVYCAGAALFDLNEPGRLIARSEEPILKPETAYEKNGFVPDVVFPTACVPDDTGRYIFVFCGAADEHVEVIKLSLDDIMMSLKAF